MHSTTLLLPTDYEPNGYDDHTELVPDTAIWFDDSIRLGRAAYAVMHAIIDKETP